jgi:hypothetical protein
MNPTRSSLEPMGRFALTAFFVHGVVLLGLAYWGIGEWQAIRGSPKPAMQWMAPSDVTSAMAKVETSNEKLDLPVATVPIPSPAPDISASTGRAPRIDIVVVKPEPNKALVPVRKMGTPDLIDVSESLPGAETGVDMSKVDSAIVARFRENWILPEGIDYSVRKTVEMDVSVFRDGSVGGFLLVKPSGVSQVDVSALKAAEKIKSIGVPLPVEFLGDRYEVRMHFHAE